MISTPQLLIKRCFDLVLSLLLLPLCVCPIILCFTLACIDTRQWGVFSQTRVGQHGRFFSIYKIRTLRGAAHRLGTYEASMSSLGRFLRGTKLDELPQLFNVLIGDMSFVGPRPDVPGFADVLDDESRILLRLKPGITGPATLKYKHEDRLLNTQKFPEHYNRTVIWPDKVKINIKYMETWRFYVDLGYILKSLFN
ncbi:sugar transferase [Lacinutrix undariae]